MQSISQISTIIRKSKQHLERVLNEIQIEGLMMKEELENKFCTIDNILQQIPSNQTLQERVRQSSKMKKQHTILNYDGEYQIVKKAKQRIEFMKSQAKNIYFLMSDLKLNRECKEFELLKQNQIILKSYSIKNTHSAKKQRICKKNSIQDTYFTEKKKEESQESLKNDENKRLTKEDMLIVISIYDSISGLKTHETIFLTDHPLVKLVQQIECLVQKLQKSNILVGGQESNGSFLLVEDRIYIHGSTKSNDYIDKIIQNIQATSCSSILKFQMAKSYFRQLRVVLGKPYMFRHLGGCDHTIIFKQFRLFDEKSDLEKKCKYPLEVYQAKFKTRKCEGCQYNNAEIVVTCDPIKNGHNVYLCMHCYQLLYPSQPNYKNPFKTIKYIHD